MLHHRFIVITLPKAQRRERNSAFAVLLHDRFDAFVRRNADIEIAVGGHDHPVDAALDEMGPGSGVSKFHALTTGGRATRFKAIECSLHIGRIAGGLEDNPGCPGIDDNRNLVAG